ncbi:histidine phosphatase family protein [Paenibacillus sp. H1-7]|uniref:histidine phosphatase family protein n=1 Tax=Paenibacillus sp. H1-7 TaxID=2282849 RepID=UPI001EF9A2FB|nr:histidine phosphatase family protein [Paenibacillus sp. H1-7]ULL16393.1 histidine phosphatase family protein [Paenibacillus sp. H1-7]
MIYVVRHGQTDLNREGRLQGRMGLPLNDNGVRQAKLLRDKLENVVFDYVYTSPQERAIQTAVIVTGIKPIIDERLDVFDLGEADLLKKGEVKMSGVVPDSKFYKGVEEVPSFINRIFSFMNELKAMHTDSKVNLFISGHRCTTGCIGAYFEGIPNDGNILRFSSDNGEYKVYSHK